MLPYQTATNYETLNKEDSKTDGQQSKKGNVVYEELRLKFNQPNPQYNKLAGGNYADIASKINGSQQQFENAMGSVGSIGSVASAGNQISKY
jgi:hypothetical protein